METATLYCKSEKEFGPGDDIEMINSQDQWPVFPYLPLRKGSSDDPEMLGLLWDFENPKNKKRKIVRIANLFMIPELVSEWNQLPSFTYMNAKALVADGWVVD